MEEENKAIRTKRIMSSKRKKRMKDFRRKLGKKWFKLNQGA